jgi:hypothetical protein
VLTCALQLVTVQMPLTHAEVPLGVEQTLPHVPQLFTSVLTSKQLEPHSVKPALQATPHVPLLHVGTPLPLLEPGQTLPHAPQLLTSVLSLKQLEPQSV